MLATKQWKSASESFGRAAEALDESGLPPDRLRVLRADVRDALAALAGKAENGTADGELQGNDRVAGELSDTAATSYPWQPLFAWSLPRFCLIPITTCARAAREEGLGDLGNRVTV